MASPASSTPVADTIEYRAKVISVWKWGSRNGYFIANPLTKVSEVFDTETEVSCAKLNWQGSFIPRKNQLVILSGVVEFDRGWRAMRARPITPETQNSEVHR